LFDRVFNVKYHSITKTGIIYIKTGVSSNSSVSWSFSISFVEDLLLVKRLHNITLVIIIIIISEALKMKIRMTEAIKFS